jgi:hypothetical protein
LFDTKVPVNPEGFSERLRSAGFKDIHIDIRRHAFRFHARKVRAGDEAEPPGLPIQHAVRACLNTNLNSSCKAAADRTLLYP